MSQRACRRYLPEKAGLCAQIHRHHIVAVEDHLVDVVELAISEVLVDEGSFLLITKRYGILLHIHSDALLETRALER